MQLPLLHTFDQLVDVCLVIVRKLSSGLVPPGSPGTYKRKSSSAENPVSHYATLPKKQGRRLSAALARELSLTGVGSTVHGWPNGEENYELHDLIGKGVEGLGRAWELSVLLKKHF